MTWELALPLLIMLATGLMGAGLLYCARKIMFDPRAKDATDFAPEGGDG
jgi:hypothetical protein